MATEEGAVTRRADLWAGLLCVLLAVFALWVGSGYAVGTAGRIGPGYAPRVLALILLGLGLLMVARSALSTEAAETVFAPRPVVLVLAAVLAFAIIFSHAGLVPAILVSVAIATFAAPENRPSTALAVGAVLSLASWALFVKALKLPIPVLKLPGLLP